jgi:hypothetical protein
MKAVPDWRGRISRRPTVGNIPDKAVMRGDLEPTPGGVDKCKGWVCYGGGFGQAVSDARRVDQVKGAIRAGR